MTPKHLVAAPDKFRGTATAAEVAAAAARGAAQAGWTCAALPLADGGEGLLAAFGGERRFATVRGPLGASVRAEWHLVPPERLDGGPTAVIEMASASGLAIAGGRRRNDAVGATTFGTGQLVAEAAAAGARRIVVGCGGSATTDGGEGALAALGDDGLLDGVELVAAVDVLIGFVEAAEVFAPQKGADAAEVALLAARLDGLALAYAERYGRDVRHLPGAGAAGGLAGGLCAVGARIVPGFDLVADFVGLDAELERADLVLTGEGRLDAPSFFGKVVGGVVRRTAGRAPVLCVAGAVEASAVESGPALEVVDLSARFGEALARSSVAELVELVVAERLSAE